MEVDGHTHLTMAMINFMVAAAVSKTVTLTGPVESFKSMATSLFCPVFFVAIALQFKERHSTFDWMKSEEPDLGGSYTYADYLTWQWDEMAELIRGKIFKMSPAPTSTHQTISGELFLQIGNFLKGKRCKLFSAPFDVRLPLGSKRTSDKEITTVVRPDLCVICEPSKIDERGCLGAPDWIIEILSRHTSSKDLREKFEVYEEAGIKEYWVVHPQEQTLLVFVLDGNGKYIGVPRPYVASDKVPSMTLKGLTIDLQQVFPKDDL